MSIQADSRTEGSLTARACWKGLGTGGVGPRCWWLSCRSFGPGGGDPVGFVDYCSCLHCFAPSRSVPDEVLRVCQVDLQLLQGSLQSVLIASYLTSLSTRSHGDISMEELFG
ncbi:unnamed protein product [Schistocephalus solidus]|uniref:Uncharacterized protein n=1 Tax=Schistocephalus solidus TaxID=70667 RepID=A0A183TNJ8_SCHSO|nr:unnamed protein product [Schistocephalus solidus]